MKKLLFSAFFLGLSLAAGAQDVNVLYLDGSSHVVKMAEVDKIELTGGTVSLVTTSGDTQSHKMTDIDRIVFGDATGIATLKPDTKADITVRSTGYSFEVQGLADGDEVAVYTQNGALMGRAKSTGGSASIDASAYVNGVYVIKAGGRSLKMLKR